MNARQTGDELEMDRTIIVRGVFGRPILTYLTSRPQVLHMYSTIPLHLSLSPA